jgi:3-amino-5-hydroxybenzoate synthase
LILLIEKAKILKEENDMNKLAKAGGTPCKTKPFHEWPYSDERELELVSEVVKSRKWWRMSGSKVEEFESKFAKLHNAEYCLGVTNGTHAIELALTALGIGPGDEVIVPAFTFISTATAVVYCNASPILVDIDPMTFCMRPEVFEKAITPRTKAVIPVHIAGHACDMDSICEIAKKHGIKVIEDAAHAHGAEWKNRKLGSFGDISIFSFQNGKLMTCGEGGALVTNSKDLYEKAYLAHGVGRPKGDRFYAHVMLGSNYRMNEFQAAVLIAQMERLPNMSIKREENAAKLDSYLSDIKGIIPQGRDLNANINPHYMYMFYYNPEYFGGLSRQDFVDSLIAEGIPAYIAYPVISDTIFFKENNFGGRIKEYSRENEADLTNARKIACEVVWLPHFTLLGDETDIKEIADAIKKIQSASCQV